jgi:hydrogenase/urease accessory protein HupE
MAFKAALGTAILTFVLGLLGIMLPFVEGIVAFFVGAVGLGAVALTQFGRKPYPHVDAVVSEFAEDEVKIANVLDTLPDDDLPSKGH